LVALAAEPVPSRPTLLPGEYPVATFDLYRGSGKKVHGCMFVAFGPGIKPDDLEVKYVKENSVEISIKGTGDALVCSGFYSPGRRTSALAATFRFYDANRWTFEDIDQRAHLRALATPLPQTSQSPGARPRDAARCVVDGAVYPDYMCPQELQAPVAAAQAEPEVESSPRLPDMQPGRWNFTGGERELCGDPFMNIRGELGRVAELQKMGCSVTSTSTGPRTMAVVVDCPATAVSADGSRMVLAGRTSISVTSPTPQIFTLDLQARDGKRHHVRGVRAGDC
jgi:hypothetical protein